MNGITIMKNGFLCALIAIITISCSGSRTDSTSSSGKSTESLANPTPDKSPEGSPQTPVSSNVNCPHSFSGDMSLEKFYEVTFKLHEECRLSTEEITEFFRKSGASVKELGI
jgi:PBP1b-binding outer membrane lipoprotein LpoB